MAVAAALLLGLGAVGALGVLGAPGTAARADAPDDPPPSPGGAMPGAAAFTPAPWHPGGLDSTRAWCLEARALLAGAKSDTIGPHEQEAYELLDRVTRSALRQLGPNAMRGAPGILAVFDSLKLDVEMASDPKWPQFVLVTYFNPAFAGYACWSTIYWWRGPDLRAQSILLPGGRNVQMGVWWTGNALGPYEMGLVDHRRTGDTREGYFTMLRMSRNGDFWGAVQYGKTSFPLVGPGPSRFVDLNGDGVPELAHWAVSPPDQRFVADMNLPPILSEATWTRADDGFHPLDHRTVPSPFATWVLFLRALTAGQAALARSLCTGPEPFATAQRLKLGAVTAKDSWHVGETPDPAPWRSEFALGYGTPGNREHECRVTLREVEGHWLIAAIRTPRVPVPPRATP